MASLSSRFAAKTANMSDNADRLPKNVKPVHYDIYIEPQLSIAKFIGTVIIELEVLEAATSISLNTLDIDIVDTEVQGDHGKVVRVKEVKYDKETSTSLFVLSETLPQSLKARIQLNFTGRMDAQAVGFFRSSYKLDGVTKYIGSTQMQPVDCRRVFLCFDEPALKAKFKLTLFVDEELDCVGNMPISSVEWDCGRKRVDFETTPLMSTYLVAFAVGKFNYIETEKDDFKVPVRVWATEDKRIEQGRFSLDLAARALKAYETTFGLDYPLPKMDMMAIPGHRGGMENWGLVLYDESLLLVDEERTSADAIRWIGKVVVHELAHQWFGNIVTMEFWNDIWLNESFADWASVYMYQSLNPEWKQTEEFVSGPLQEAFELDSDQATHPIEVPVRRAKDISEVFDAISYSKGCAVLLEISNYLGEKTFLKGIRRHLQLNKYGNARAADLWKALSHASGQDVGKIMSTLTREAGYPIVTVRENESDETIFVEQHRFLANGATASWKEDVCYPVFLNILTASDVKDKYQLLRRTNTFKVPLDFYKLNHKQKGFYRVAYSPKRLRILAENIKEGLLSEQDRIGIISDVTALTSAKVYKITTVLDLLYNFIDEESFFVWNQIFASLQHINHAWIFDDSGISESLSSFQKDLAYLVLKHHGWAFSKSDGIIEQRLKGLLFANAGGNPDVVKAAFELFKKYVAGEKNPINPNIREAVFAIVLQHGGSREYNAVLSGIYDAESLDERNTCLQSLGQARSPQLIQRTLNFALSDEIILRAETPKTIKSLSSHREGREALWEWLQTHWDEINQKVPRSIKTIEVFVQICIAPLATKKHLEEVKAFFKDKDTTGYRLELSKALNTIQMMAEWAERDRDDVKKWFKAHSY